MFSADQVLDGAIAELNRHPTATMADIASAVGISRATLHRQFASRDALLHTIGARSLDRWAATHALAGLDTVGADDPDAISAALELMLEAYVALAEDFGFLFADDYGSAELAERAEVLMERETAFYACAQAAGVLRSDVPARWITHVVFGFMFAARSALRAEDVARRGFHELVRSSLIAGVGR